MATILIVDDQPTNREFLVTLLQYDGHRLLEAADGLEALQQVRSHCPDLVITDILMPRMDGYEFVRQLRADPAITQTAVIFYTGIYHEREAHALAQACGACQFLTKPSEAPEILRCVRNTLGLAPPPAASAVPENFDREHLRLLNNTLTRKVRELRQAKELAEQSLTQLQAVFSSVSEGMAMLDGQGRILNLNAAGRQIHGFPADFDACKPLRDLETLFEVYDLAGRLLPFEQWPLARAAAGERFSGCEVRVRRVDTGHEFTGSYAGTPVMGNVGRTSLSVATVRDITAQKQAEQALRQSEERFRLLVEGTQDYGIFLLDPEGRVASWNAGAQRITGYEEQEILGRSVARLYAQEDAQSGKPQEEVKLAAQRGRCESEGQRVRKDGSRFWASVVTTALRDPAGRLYGFSKVIRDITERKRVEEESRRAKEVAETANAAKDHFLAVLSHELRTPLTPVVASVSALQHDPRLDDDLRRTMEMIHRNVELEARLIDDLLDVTRITRGKIELSRQPVVLGTVIRQAADVCRADIEARGLHFGIDLKDAPHLVYADAPRLQQVFWNLLKNAIKFTPHGGCVGIRCWRENGSIVTEVIDSGVGIEPEHLPRVFQAFEQGGRGTTRQFGGLGLGLAICKALVEMHDGSIEAHSAGKDRGASFRISLPVHINAPLETPHLPSEAAAANGIEHSASALRILLIEDHGDTAKAIGRLLEIEGHRVQMAGDVVTAMEMVFMHEFDLIISDLGLPDGSGLDIMRAVRSRGSALPGIALSGYGMEQDVRQSREAGFAEHLTKPVNIERLLAVMQRVIRRHGPTVEAESCPPA